MMHFESDGAQHFPAAVAREQLEGMAQHLPQGSSPGIRISDLRPLKRWVAASGEVGRLAASILGPRCRAVRAILFDKSAQANWSLGWHQDRSIAVVGRADLPGFERWTVKDGTIHVEPPFATIEGMITARVHLDAVDAHNAPLLISPGSHRLGRIPESDVAAVVARCGEAACLAAAGDVWLYRTAILHASAKARKPARRRVLQLDYSAAQLPEPLRWAIRV